MRLALRTGILGAVTPATSRPVGRPRALDRARVAEAVLAVGLPGLSAPDVARRLGVSTATLYRFVPGRDAMVDLALGHLLRSTDWPRPDDGWRAYLEQVTWTVWRLARDHPGLAEVSPTVVLANADLMGLYNRVSLDLVDLGFPPAEAAVAVDFVLDLAIDSVKSREALGSEGGAEGTWDRELDPVFLPVMREALHADPAVWFERKLRIALDGIGHVLLGPHGGPGTGGAHA